MASAWLNKQLIEKYSDEYEELHDFFESVDIYGGLNSIENFDFWRIDKTNEEEYYIFDTDKRIYYKGWSTNLINQLPIEDLELLLQWVAEHILLKEDIL